MFTGRIVRFLRKKIVLAILFTISFCYCVFHWLPEADDSMADDNMIPPINLPSQSFKWHTSYDKTNHSSKITSCRNSVQGKVLIADDKGYVCSRHDVLSNGCCNVDSSTTSRYNCESCHENGCCSIYEYCISCCLQPEKRMLLMKILGKASETFNILFASITDHFELCLTKCRTSSQSVQHENSYTDPKAKHCYGESPPAAQLGTS
ncbi:SREBP regulating gene protein [Parasteatoda tepidariorum]|uniref:SREBP regulating gene protein n=1 Tax=Parasteatoda tepidariorum TaxID=114398 RepID=UPI000A2C0A80|nr:SREBP regulating gene protein [Parasteatoda tepidariorum]